MNNIAPRALFSAKREIFEFFLSQLDADITQEEFCNRLLSAEEWELGSKKKVISLWSFVVNQFLNFVPFQIPVFKANHDFRSWAEPAEHIRLWIRIRKGWGSSHQLAIGWS